MNNEREAITAEETASEVGTLAEPQINIATPPRKRLKALLAVAGVLSVALACNITLSDNGSLEAGTVARADANRTQGIELAPGTQVFKQAMPMYHWQTKCPLADATSLRTGTKTAALARKSMSVEAAEKRGLHPCVYCADVD